MRSEYKSGEGVWGTFAVNVRVGQADTSSDLEEEILQRPQGLKGRGIWKKIVVNGVERIAFPAQ